MYKSICKHKFMYTHIYDIKSKIFGHKIFESKTKKFCQKYEFMNIIINQNTLVFHTHNNKSLVIRICIKTIKL